MTDDDLNGFGTRLNKMELTQSQHCVKIERNEDDIQDAYTIIGRMERTVNAMIWKIFLMVSIPTLLLAGQFLWKASNNG